MRLVIQRVSRASVAIEGRTVSGIGNGLLVLVGVETGDTEEDMRWLVGKTVGLRIFNDENGVMNRSVVDVGGEVLAVSQFTLTASTKKGNRPSYIRAAGHDLAVPLYEKYCEEVSADARDQIGGDRQAGRQRSIRRGYAGLPCQRWSGDDNHRLKDSGIDSQPLNEYYKPAAVVMTNLTAVVRSWGSR